MEYNQKQRNEGKVSLGHESYLKDGFKKSGMNGYLDIEVSVQIYD